MRVFGLFLRSGKLLFFRFFFRAVSKSKFVKTSLRESKDLLSLGDYRCNVVIVIVIIAIVAAAIFVVALINHLNEKEGVLMKVCNVLQHFVFGAKCAADYDLGQFDCGKGLVNKALLQVERVNNGSEVDFLLLFSYWYHLSFGLLVVILVMNKAHQLFVHLFF